MPICAYNTLTLRTGGAWRRTTVRAGLLCAMLGGSGVTFAPERVAGQERVPVGVTASRGGEPPGENGRRGVWTQWVATGAFLIGAVLVDGEIREWMGERHGEILDDIARAGNLTGRSANIRPVLAASLAGGYLTGSRPWLDATLHAAVAYAGGDAIASLLKPVVGRRRPGGGDPNRFDPLTWHGGDWHSFPSAHAVHAFSLAAAIAEEVQRPWASAAAYGAASVVAWSRVYDDAHWTSDVVAGAIVGIASGKAAVRLLHRARDRESDAFRVFFAPGTSGMLVLMRFGGFGAFPFR